MNFDDDFLVWQIEDAEDFWSELQEYCCTPDDSSVLHLDGKLKMFIRLCGQYHVKFLIDSTSFNNALDLIMNSDLFTFHCMRMQNVLIDFIIGTTDPHQLYIAYNILLKYVRINRNFFKSLNNNFKSLVPILLDTIRNVDEGYFGEDDDGTGLVPIEIKLRSPVMNLLYEYSRSQILSNNDLMTFNENFIDHLFDLVELTRDEIDESFNYTIIKFLTSLNEQYMIKNLKNDLKSNLILNILIRRLGNSKTFGENLIFILNRLSITNDDVCFKLLVLKILFLLFTTIRTQDYFYTNDLKVLIDVFLREISDLPDEFEVLRNTYLRVLYPLLDNSQAKFGKYKIDEIFNMLLSLIKQTNYFDVSSTTLRLVKRCLSCDCFQEKRGNDENFYDDVDSMSSPNQIALANGDDVSKFRNNIRAIHSTSDLLSGYSHNLKNVNISSDIASLNNGIINNLNITNKNNNDGNEIESPLSAPASTTQSHANLYDEPRIPKNNNSYNNLRKLPPPPRPCRSSKPMKRPSN